jgi:hypothetical protein
LPGETEKNDEKCGLQCSVWKNRFLIIIGSVKCRVVQELCPDGVINLSSFPVVTNKGA